MGLFDKFKAGFAKTHSKLTHEIKRIVTRSPRLEGTSLEELEAALIGADLGWEVTGQIMQAVKKGYETQGSEGLDVFGIAEREVVRSLEGPNRELARNPGELVVVSIVGVNGTGKTTTAAKLAHLVRSRGHTALLAACDTFRAAAIEQLKLWGQRLKIDVIATTYGADAAAVAQQVERFLAVIGGTIQKDRLPFYRYGWSLTHEKQSDAGTSKTAPRRRQAITGCAA